jgi:hypothetical protein
MLRVINSPPRNFERVFSHNSHFEEALRRLGGEAWRRGLEERLGGEAWRRGLEERLGGEAWRRGFEEVFRKAFWEKLLREAL